MVVGAPFRHWNKSVDLFEEPRLKEAKYAHVRDRVRQHDEVDGLMQPWLDRHTKREIAQAGLDRNMAFGYLADIEEAVQSPQWAEREFLVDVDLPEGGSQKFCGSPFRMSEVACESASIPRLGEHNQEVLEEYGCGAEHPVESREPEKIQ